MNINFKSKYEENFYKGLKDRLNRIGINTDIFVNFQISNEYNVDFYLPEYMLIIEINPTSTHHSNKNIESYKGVPKDYHKNKYEYFFKYNIIQLYENDFSDDKTPKDYVFKIIARAIGLNPRIQEFEHIYTRNISIYPEIDTVEVFINRLHCFIYTKDYYNGELSYIFELDYINKQYPQYILLNYTDINKVIKELTNKGYLEEYIPIILKVNNNWYNAHNIECKHKDTVDEVYIYSKTKYIKEPFKTYWSSPRYPYEILFNKQMKYIKDEDIENYIENTFDYGRNKKGSHIVYTAGITYCLEYN